ncbi:uncharacterized protein LOC135476093 [Liolophura sinensis]|uniref:uncharacterized protein LOC135476093 n=1 Tax=Liolophura sinensis TaxID=3198878 RepID=UPI00315872B7
MKNKGRISAAELLLNRVQRLKKDVCSGLRDAFRKSGMDGVIEEMTQCYEDFQEKDEGDEDFGLSPSLSRLSLGGSFRKRSSLGSSGLSDEEEASSPPGARCVSPTLCEPKILTLRDYQKELYSVVKECKKTMILCPAKSGKRFVALKAIKEHLSLACNPDGKVAYLVTKSSLAGKVLRRCQVFLNDIPCVQIGTESSDGPLSKVLQENSVLIAKAKLFKNALEEDVVKWTDFSMVILELGADYYEQRKDVYKQIMKKYHKFKRPFQQAQQAQHMPQILVLSTSLCRESPLENLFCTAMETCANFDIHAVAVVRHHIDSLRQHVSIPHLERTTVPEKQDRGFDERVNELMSRVEETMKKVYQSTKMPVDEDHPENRRAEVISPPADRTSVKYMTWLKTNKASLRYGAKKGQCKRAAFFWTCLRLATIYQSGLFINTECRRFDALNYMRRKVKTLKENLTGPLDDNLMSLFEDFYEKENYLKSISKPYEEDNTATVVRNKLVEIYRVNTTYKVAVLVKYPMAILSMKFCLMKTLSNLELACVLGHQQDYTVETNRLFETGFHVLITTWPILAFHLGKEMRTWDYVVRTDCPGNDVITWTHPGRPVTDSAQSENPVDLLTESSIEKVALEIAQQQQDSSGLYRALLNDIQIASSERELWSRSTRNLTKLYDEIVGDFFCNGCGNFVCNRAHVRNLDDLWLGLDPNLIHRFSAIKHSTQIVFSNGYAKLGRFVCKECGQKWGIIAHVLGRTHLAFSKEGLDYLVDGRLQEYHGKWKYANIEIKLFDYNRDVLRCLPSSFCVEGETIAELQSRLPEPVED